MASASSAQTSGRHLPGRSDEDSPASPATPGQVVDELINRVDQLLVEAVGVEASDIHFEPLPTGRYQIRVRIDGVLFDHTVAARTFPDGRLARITPFPATDKESMARVLGRISSSAEINFDPAIPQDGGIEAPVRARVASSPTVYGPLMVLRLFPGRTELPPLVWQGTHDEQAWQDMQTGAGGLILVVGPTGSGKSTTVFHALAYHISQGKAVSTIEDPVEYPLEGARQAEVGQRSGFATFVRGAARIDSDVLFVGELRDADTVQTVITAANRGRTVFSTLHANEAAAAAASLEALGVDTRLLANVVNGIVAQRLLRRCCPTCKSTGGDCPTCNGTGYYGRVAVREVIYITDAIRDAIRRNASPTEIRELAKRDGMRTMREHAAELVATGITTEAEVKENIGS
jgi:type II secretory ATPase GspE/PulE/Tfp pilus assembly ATPase PilB-like protein